MRTIDSYFSKQPSSYNLEKYLPQKNKTIFSKSKPTTNKANVNEVEELIEGKQRIEVKEPIIVKKSLEVKESKLFISKKTLIPNDIIRVYTDGACSKNGSRHAKAGIGVFLGEGDPRNISRRVEGKQTNNTAELQAIIDVFKVLEKEINEGKEIRIYSDSQYSIRCCTTYGSKCHGNGWKNDKGPIPNLQLVQQAYYLFRNKKNVKLIKVEAHTGKKDRDSIGNDWADRLANQAIGVDTNDDNRITKIYLKVPFSKKEQIKGIGGKWDPKKKKWYMMSNIYKTKSDLVDAILK